MNDKVLNTNDNLRIRTMNIEYECHIEYEWRFIEYEWLIIEYEWLIIEYEWGFIE